MCTTLSIDDDLLLAVKEIARSEAKSAGAVVSDLLRQSLILDMRDSLDGESVFGFRPFLRRGGVVTNELIDRLCEQVGD